MIGLWLTLACTGAPKGAAPEPQAPAPEGVGSTGERPPDPAPQALEPPPAPEAEELRGIWVTRWTWSGQAEVDQALTEIADAGFNVVFFQVRGSFDAYYQSALEPWAARLTGTLGGDPGWDPLAFAIERGHALGLEIHAYVNVFPFWRGLEMPTESAPRHPLLAHPEWRLRDADGALTSLKEDYYVFASPGDPQVRAWLTSVVADLDHHYDVDGIHLDYVRYPGREQLDPSGPGTPAWRREQINQTVSSISEVVEVPVTAAVWGVYENRWGWPDVSEGLTGYDQDSAAMLERGLLDATIPMVYWQVSEPPGQRLDFRTLAEDHLSRSAGRHVYPGFEARYGLQPAIDCARVARELGAPGFVLFDYSQAKAWLADFGAAVFAEPARVPEMPWR